MEGWFRGIAVRRLKGNSFPKKQKLKKGKYRTGTTVSEKNQI